MYVATFMYNKLLFKDVLFFSENKPSSDTTYKTECKHVVFVVWFKVLIVK